MAGVDHLLQYGNVQAESVTSLVHGAMFTRGGEDLGQTAIFIGGSNVHTAEELMKSVSKVFFGPVRVSVMLDANGCNTTAAAAVVAASHRISLEPLHLCSVERAPWDNAWHNCLLWMERKSHSRVVHRRKQIRFAARNTKQSAGRTQSDGNDLETLLSDPHFLNQQQIIIACGAAGVELLNEDQIQKLSNLSVAIDLNAVPPAGLGE